MIQAPFNSIIVTIDTKFIANFSNMIKRANLNPGSRINPSDYVNIIGTIISIPKAISKKEEYAGFSTKDIKPGDKAIFRYDVVFDFVEQGENIEPVYKNRIWFKGNEYWLCDIQKLFAVIRDNELIMVNGYCMIEGMTAAPVIIIPHSVKRIVEAAEAMLTQIGNNLTHTQNSQAVGGESVFYNSKRVQEYEVNGKKIGILRQQDLLGRKNLD